VALSATGDFSIVFTTDFRRVYAAAIKSWMGYYRAA
jgi:hypothetical protein